MRTQRLPSSLCQGPQVLRETQTFSRAHTHEHAHFHTCTHAHAYVHATKALARSRAHACTHIHTQHNLMLCAYACAALPRTRQAFQDMWLSYLADQVGGRGGGVERELIDPKSSAGNECEENGGKGSLSLHYKRAIRQRKRNACLHTLAQNEDGEASQPAFPLSRP